MTNARRWVKSLLLTVAMAMIAVVGFVLIASRGIFTASLPASEAGGSVVVVGTSGHRLAGRVYLTGRPGLAAPLVIVLHGDAPFTNPRYQYAFASNLADLVSGTHVVALLRPGYADPFGAKSDGDRGFALVPLS
jgi:hypothetical protein